MAGAPWRLHGLTPERPVHVAGGPGEGLSFSRLDREKLSNPFILLAIFLSVAFCDACHRNAATAVVDPSPAQAPRFT